jgi:hypothetical protein
VKRFIVLLLLVSCVGVACRQSNAPVPTPAPPTDPPFRFFEGTLEGAALTVADVGQDKWEADAHPTPSTVLMGGEIGPANIDIAEAEATTAFNLKDGDAYLSNTLLLLEDEDTARAVMAKHDEVDDDRRWKQERNDGGKATYKRTGRVEDLPSLGDEAYSATLDANIEDAQGSSVDRKLEYVVFRVRNLVAFVVTQDASAEAYVQKLDAKVTKLTT